MGVDVVVASTVCAMVHMKDGPKEMYCAPLVFIVLIWHLHVHRAVSLRNMGVSNNQGP